MFKFLKKRKYFKQVKGLDFIDIIVMLKCNKEDLDKKKMKLFKKDLKLLNKYLGKYTLKKMGVCKYLVDRNQPWGYGTDLYHNPLPKDINSFSDGDWFIPTGYNTFVVCFWGYNNELENTLNDKLKTLRVEFKTSPGFTSEPIIKLHREVNEYLGRSTEGLDILYKKYPFLTDLDCKDCGVQDHELDINEGYLLEVSCNQCGDRLSSIRSKKVIKKIIKSFKHYLAEYKNNP